MLNLKKLINKTTTIYDILTTLCYTLCFNCIKEIIIVIIIIYYI